MFEVEIISTNSPVEPGDTLEIEYRVTNTGDEVDTQEIQLTLDAEEDLPEGETRTVDSFVGGFEDFWENTEDFEYIADSNAPDEYAAFRTGPSDGLLTDAYPIRPRRGGPFIEWDIRDMSGDHSVQFFVMASSADQDADRLVFTMNNMVNIMKLYRFSDDHGEILESAELSQVTGEYVRAIAHIDENDMARFWVYDSEQTQLGALEADIGDTGDGAYWGPNPIGSDDTLRLGRVRLRANHPVTGDYYTDEPQIDPTDDPAITLIDNFSGGVIHDGWNNADNYNTVEDEDAMSDYAVYREEMSRLIADPDQFDYHFQENGKFIVANVAQDDPSSAFQLITMNDDDSTFGDNTVEFIIFPDEAYIRTRDDGSTTNHESVTWEWPDGEYVDVIGHYDGETVRMWVYHDDEQVVYSDVELPDFDGGDYFGLNPNATDDSLRISHVTYNEVHPYTGEHHVEGEVPVVQTLSPSNVSETSATLRGSVESLGSYNEIEVRFNVEGDIHEYGTKDSEEAFSVELTNLERGTQYSYHVEAVADGTIIAEGDPVAFTTEDDIEFDIEIEGEVFDNQNEEIAFEIDLTSDDDTHYLGDITYEAGDNVIEDDFSVISLNDHYVYMPVDPGTYQWTVTLDNVVDEDGVSYDGVLTDSGTVSIEAVEEPDATVVLDWREDDPSDYLNVEAESGFDYSVTNDGELYIEGWGNMHYSLPDNGHGRQFEVYQKWDARAGDGLHFGSQDTLRWGRIAIEREAGPCGSGTDCQPSGDDGFGVTLYSTTDRYYTSGTGQEADIGVYGYTMDWYSNSDVQNRSAAHNVDLTNTNTIELYINLNTWSGGTADANGVIGIWVNDELCYYRDDKRFTTDENNAVQEIGPHTAFDDSPGGGNFDGVYFGPTYEISFTDDIPSHRRTDPERWGEETPDEADITVDADVSDTGAESAYFDVDLFSDDDLTYYGDITYEIDGQSESEEFFVNTHNIYEHTFSLSPGQYNWTVTLDNIEDSNDVPYDDVITDSGTVTIEEYDDELPEATIAPDYDDYYNTSLTYNGAENVYDQRNIISSYGLTQDLARTGNTSFRQVTSTSGGRVGTWAKEYSWWTNLSSAREAYIEFDIIFPEGIDWWRSDGTIRFHWVAYRPGSCASGTTCVPSGDDGWSIVTSVAGPDRDTSPRPSSDHHELRVGMYHMDSMSDPNPTGGFFDVTNWTRLGYYHRHNSGTSSSANRDGVVRAWIDGEMVWERTGLAFGYDTSSEYSDYNGPMGYTWAGSDPTPGIPWNVDNHRTWVNEDIPSFAVQGTDRP